MKSTNHFDSCFLFLNLQPKAKASEVSISKCKRLSSLFKIFSPKNLIHSKSMYQC